MDYRINPKNVFKLLFATIGLLMVAHLLGVISTYYFNHDQVFGLVPLFNVNFEANIPTYYQSFALMVCAVLLVIISKFHHAGNEPYRLWGGLAVIFLFLSIDEFTMIHEKFVLPFREIFNTSGFLYFAWVIPYAVLVGVVGLVYLKFLLRLPRRTRLLFVVAGLLYVSGALGFELLDGYFVSAGVDNIKFALTNSIEEFLEMFGVIVFLYALQDYFGSTFRELTISIGGEVS